MVVDMDKKIEVSVICMTYNHEKYIAKALDTIISQRTDFNFEIVVHDDCSTDSTADIIREYEKKYPDIVKPIYEKENQYSKGADVFMELTLPQARGRYIAVCEGDDYWLDDDKLQIQFNAMEKHPEVDMCACGAMEMAESVESLEIRPQLSDGILPVEDVILGGGRYLATSSLFFRKELFDEFMEFEKVICFDYSNQIKGALRGGIYYVNRIMSVYRKAVENSWTKRIERDKKKREEHINTEIAMLRQLDIDTNGRYKECIERRITAYTPFYDQLQMHKDEALEELSDCKEKIYLWGLGMRGDAIQEFCRNEHIMLDGVCDKQNAHIGENTVYDFKIVDTEYVLANSKVVLASNHAIYDYLKKIGYEGLLIDFHKYMPLA